MSYDLLLQKALKLFDDGQFDEAEALFRRILETAPEQPDLLNLLGLTAQAKGAHEEACTLFAKVLRIKGADAAVYYNLAYSLKLDGKPYEAVSFFEKALAINPEIKEAYNELGLIAMASGDMEKARKNFKKAVDKDASYAEARVNLARSYVSENPIRAIEELESIAAVFPDDAASRYYLSCLYYERGEFTKAWNAAVQAKEKAPASAEVRVMLGMLSLQEKQVENAKVYFSKALLLAPDNTDALLHLADIHSREGSFEKAEAGYKRLIELNAKDFNAHHNYAEMLYRQKRTAEALEEYRQAVILEPKSAEVSNNLGIILKDTGEYEEALGLFLNAFVLNPEIEEISINLSETLTLFFRQEPKKAVKVAEKWLEYAPDNYFARHVTAAFKGEKCGNNQIYSQKLFDHFADRYESVVENLGYTVPVVMGRIAGSLKGTVVDLGCGTGLVGEVLKNSENTLIGVDISTKMLEKADQKGVYSQLVCSEIVEYLRQKPDFDWGIAADVFGYVGDLTEVISLCRGKKLLFSTEITETGDYEISENGRYRHHKNYILRLLEENGFFCATAEDVVLRSENGKDVAGVIWKALPR